MIKPGAYSQQNSIQRRKTSISNIKKGEHPLINPNITSDMMAANTGIVLNQSKTTKHAPNYYPDTLKKGHLNLHMEHSHKIKAYSGETSANNHMIQNHLKLKSQKVS